MKGRVLLIMIGLLPFLYIDNGYCWSVGEVYECNGENYKIMYSIVEKGCCGVCGKKCAELKDTCDVKYDKTEYKTCSGENNTGCQNWTKRAYVAGVSVVRLNLGP